VEVTVTTLGSEEEYVNVIVVLIFVPVESNTVGVLRKPVTSPWFMEKLVGLTVIEDGVGEVVVVVCPPHEARIAAAARTGRNRITAEKPMYPPRSLAGDVPTIG
jgi:hypothetical protein